MQGSQQPRIHSAPKYKASTGAEAVELAALAGLHLDPWQQLVLRDALGERKDGQWAAATVGVVCPRQNGKNGILEARELAGLFLLGEKLLVHTAHQYDTSMEAFGRLKFLIQNTPEFDKRVKRYINQNGAEGIEMKNGQRIRFRTRTKGGGRGFSGDCVIFDEAMEFPQASLNAILPIVSARPNPQIWYTGSAVDQEIHQNGEVLTRLRNRAIAGDDPRLAYSEWSVDAASPDDINWERLDFDAATAMSNPALGFRITLEYVRSELVELGRRGFAVERWGVGDWPDLTGGGSVISLELWDGLADKESQLLDPVCFAFDVSPSRDYASICAAGARPDGLRHLDLVDRRRGTGWLPARIKELADKWAPQLVVTDDIGPGSSLVPELEQLGVQVTRVKTREHQEAVGMFVDAVDQAKMRHLGRDELRAAIKGATKRTVTDRWLWDRKNSTVDITPLVAATLAHWASHQDGPSVYEDRGIISFSLNG